jgi:hypothetical protein
LQNIAKHIWQQKIDTEKKEVRMQIHACRFMTKQRDIQENLSTKDLSADNSRTGKTTFNTSSGVENTKFLI